VKPDPVSMMDCKRPQPCTPDSDANAGTMSNPADAGSAFLELQFYPPKFAPFIDGISCDARHWCTALTIDSLECTFAFATCNNNCIEPVNFAYLQMDGVPARRRPAPGARTISVNGTPQTASWPVAGCQDNSFQNGDLDFDGSPYAADWPDGSSSHPTSFSYIGPFTDGHRYPQIQFETDLGASEIDCNIATGAGCTAPPLGPGGPAFTRSGHWRTARSGACGTSATTSLDGPCRTSAVPRSTARRTPPGSAAPWPAL
jgi:hypothetical protein